VSRATLAWDGGEAVAEAPPRKQDGLLAYCVKRILLAIPILLGVTLVVFLLEHLAPGSPVDSLLGPYATPAQRTALIQHLALDRPLYLQYLTWLAEVARGDLGTSISDQASVLSVIGPAFENTLILSVAAGAFAVAAGGLVGLAWARSRLVGGRKVAEWLAVLAAATPQYAVGLVLIAVVAVRFAWLPASGMHDVATPGSIPDLLRHLVLPSFTASLVMLGIIARMVRSSLVDVYAQTWVQTLRARGYSGGRILAHAARNALPSVVTVIGLQFGYLIGGVLFVEIVFAWPGMGTVIYNAITSRDYPLIQGCVLFGAAAFVLLNIVVDVVNRVIDPRSGQAS
jgi:peptide/nickel transport system permease protein